MSSPNDAWLSPLLAALIGALLFLRVPFPKLSRRAEVALLALAMAAFLAICNALSTHNGSPVAATEIFTQARANR